MKAVDNQQRDRNYKMKFKMDRQSNSRRWNRKYRDIVTPPHSPFSERDWDLAEFLEW